jgi:hypothetical protein
VVAVEGGGRQAQWWSDCGGAEDDDDAEVGPRRRALGEMEVADGTRGGAGAVRGRTEGAGRPELAGGGASRRWDVEVGDLKKGRRPVEIRWEEKEKIRRKTKKRGVLWTFHHLPCYTARRSFAKHL